MRLATDVTCDGRINFRPGLLKYSIDITTKVMVYIYHSCQCQIANPDVRYPDHVYFGGIQILAGRLRGHGA